MGGEEINRSKDNPWPSPNRPPPYHEKSEDMSLWGVVIFGLIGATATTYAARRLRWTIDELYAQLTRSQSTWKGATGSARSFRTYFQEEAWKNYNRRMQEAYEEETERVERIRRMQSVFNRERNKCKRDYERWRESGPGAYHQNFQRDDWYWKTDTSFREQRTNFRRNSRDGGSYSLSHHYSILGLDRSRTIPYTEAEIKGLGLAVKALVVSSSGERPGFELRQPTVRSPVRAWDSRRFTHALGPQSALSGSCGSPDPIWISKKNLICILYLEYHPRLRVLKYTAFRTKAKEFHPDQNQDNKEAAEAKFKEVMISYEAIKEERKNTKY